MNTYILLLLTFIVRVSHCNNVATSQMMMMPLIDELNVKCTKEGILVDLSFTGPFNGVVYSKGYFFDKKCRYVPANSNRNSYQFNISSGTCGVEEAIGSDGSPLLTTTLIMQNDEIFQEIWDISRKIVCDWKGSISKKLAVSSYKVSMLQTEQSNFANDIDVVNVWLDVRAGIYPETVSLGDSIVKIGDPLSIVVGTQGAARDIDFQVQDCFAHSNPDPNYANSYKIQLTDSRGCVLKKKVMTPFKRFIGVGKDKGNIILASTLSAFTFPDTMNVFTSCNVEVCKTACEVFSCETKEIKLTNKDFSRVSVKTTVTTIKPFTERITKTSPATTKPTTRTTLKPSFTKSVYSVTPLPLRITPAKCYQGSQDPSCPVICSSEFQDKRCPTKNPTILPCFPGSFAPGCPIVCNKQFQDKRCKTSGVTENSAVVTTSSNFDSQRQPQRISTTPLPVNTTVLVSSRKTKKPFVPIRLTTLKLQTYSKEPKNQFNSTCNSESVDPQCFFCSRNPLDPRCKTKDSTISDCYPGSHDPFCPIVCTEVFQDVRCDSKKTKFVKEPKEPEPLNCVATPDHPECIQKQPECFPGSKNPDCPVICDNTFLDERCPSKVLCKPGSIHPSCPIICSDIFTDSRCTGLTEISTSIKKVTTTKPPYIINNYRPQIIATTTEKETYLPTSPSIKATSNTEKSNIYAFLPPNCYPGSLNPTCPIVCNELYMDKRCNKINVESPCFPGSKEASCPVICTETFQDERCKKGTETPADCFPGSKDLHCPIICNDEFQDSRCDIKSVTATFQPLITTTQGCVPGSKNPNCPVICNSFFWDERCHKDRPTQKEERPSTCYPGSLDPVCPVICTEKYRDTRCRESLTATKPGCFPGSKSPSCPIICNSLFWDERCNQDKQTSKEERPFSCYPGSSDPSCPIICSEEFRDIRCSQPLSSITPGCFPGSKAPSCPVICDSVFWDERCTKDRPVPKEEKLHNCYPGSKDPACPVVCSEQFRDIRCVVRSTSTLTSSSTPRPFSVTTRSRTKCPKDSNEPGCDKLIKTTASPIRCIYGSTDPACTDVCKGPLKSVLCPSQTTKYIQNFLSTPALERSTTPRNKLKCVLGSQDSECKPLIGQPNEPKTIVSTSTAPSRSISSPTKEWSGESQYHAFHKFHFQKGDGRRNERLFGKIGQIGKNR
ncbi:uncharacterized protein LOC136037671 isoform X1 [Artemia franciscana]|uniref:uncharacterized protein LOC136037671 isoform X1 n=1 Tax=Artemia franciscana TaxID=6661 RepID=UPI0032DABF3C